MRIREQLIQAGIKNLKETGYPSVNAANIMTDRVYSPFFDKMLTGTIGQYGKEADAEIKRIRAKIKRHKQ